MDVTIFDSRNAARYNKFSWLNQITYAYPYVYVRVSDMGIQTGQGCVTLGSIDIMIGCQLDEMQVFPGDHQQITDMKCLFCSYLYLSRM